MFSEDIPQPQTPAFRQQPEDKPDSWALSAGGQNAQILWKALPPLPNLIHALLKSSRFQLGVVVHGRNLGTRVVEAGHLESKLGFGYVVSLWPAWPT